MNSANILNQARSAGTQRNASVATAARGANTRTGITIVKRGMALRRFGAVKMGKDTCGY
jgi:hypothetical protein